MSISLREKLASIAMSEFKFLSFSKNVSSPDAVTGEKITYLIFELEEALEKVTGSTIIYNPDNKGDVGVSPTVSNVMQIRCNVELMLLDDEKEKSEFTWDVDGDGRLTGKGSYRGDLTLDVSKKEDVWLVSEKFKDFGRNMRNTGGRERYQRYVK